MSAADLATTATTTTTVATTTRETLAPAESSSTRCGSEKLMRKKFRVADNVVIACKNNVCNFRCPVDHLATAQELKCKLRGKKAAFVPKKIKKGVHCRFVGAPTKAPTTASTLPQQEGGFNTGDAAAALAAQQAAATNTGTGSSSGGFSQSDPKA